MHIYKTKIKLHETDAAGLLFFSNQFKIIHDAYEELLENIGFGFGDLIRRQNFFLPIVHAEADYRMPLFVGDVIEIRVSVTKVGETSFTFSYQLVDHNQQTVGTAKTVHVTIDKQTGKKIMLPEAMRLKVQALYEEDSVARA